MNLFPDLLKSDEFWSNFSRQGYLANGLVSLFTGGNPDDSEIFLQRISRMS